MRVLISGATGLLGQALLRALRVGGGHEVRCLARGTSPVGRLAGTEVVYGDAGDAPSMEKALRGMDAFIHAAGIEFTPWVLEAAAGAGVGRLVMVSSTSVHSRFAYRSGPRLEMEALLWKSDLLWTVARPSMIYGSELDKNMSRLLRFLDRSPVFPLFGAGENLWQPVYHEDLARGVLAALEREEAIHQTYDLPGARPLAYGELVRTAARALGRKTRMVRIPAGPVRRALELAEAARVPLPVKSGQVLRLGEDKAYPFEKAKRELGYAPRDFQEGITLEVRRLREIGQVR